MMINALNAKKLATWHAIAPTYDALTVIIMVMLQQTAPTRFHPQAHQPARCRDNNTSKCDRSTSWNNNHIRCYYHGHRDRHRFSRSRSCSHNPRYRSNSHSDSCKSCSRSFPQPSCHSTSCHRSLSTYCYCQDTPHCRPSSHNIQQTPLQNPKKTIFQFKSNTLEFPGQEIQASIDDPPSEFYSSDEQDSDSEDDLN